MQAGEPAGCAESELNSGRHLIYRLSHMFRYASRRFGLTLFIATTVDTPHCVSLALLCLPALLSSPLLASTPFDSFLFLSLSFSLSCPLFGFSLLSPVYLLHMLSLFISLRPTYTLMHVCIHRISCATPSARIAASMQQHPILHYPPSTRPSRWALYPWICLFTAAAQFPVIYTSRASRPASCPRVARSE